MVCTSASPRPRTSRSAEECASSVQTGRGGGSTPVHHAHWACVRSAEASFTKGVKMRAARARRVPSMSERRTLRQIMYSISAGRISNEGVSNTRGPTGGASSSNSMIARFGGASGVRALHHIPVSTNNGLMRCEVVGVPGPSPVSNGTQQRAVHVLGHRPEAQLMPIGCAVVRGAEFWEPAFSRLHAEPQPGQRAPMTTLS
eukprot:4762233-Prymnesium_polylepis.1